MAKIIHMLSRSPPLIQRRCEGLTIQQASIRHKTMSINEMGKDCGCKDFHDEIFKSTINVSTVLSEAVALLCNFSCASIAGP